MFKTSFLSLDWINLTVHVFPVLLSIPQREFILLDLIGTRDIAIPQQFPNTAELYENLMKAGNMVAMFKIT